MEFSEEAVSFSDAAKTKRMLEDKSQRCAVFSKEKVNRPGDRGVEGSLPIPISVNTEVAIDLVSVQDGVNYVVMIEKLTRYCLVAVVLAELTSEQAAHTFWRIWVVLFGAPGHDTCDNDIRWGDAQRQSKFSDMLQF